MVTTLRFAVIAGSLMSLAACSSSPIQPPPVVMHAHVAGTVRDAANAAVRDVEVTIACPVPDSAAQYPSSAALQTSRVSDASGAYDAWIGIDSVTLQQSGRQVGNLSMTCAVRARRNGAAVSATPATVVVQFTPAAQTPAVVPLNVQLLN